MANNQHMTSHLKKLEHPVELHGFPFQDIIKQYLFLEIKIWKIKPQNSTSHIRIEFVLL